jgi:hypothetical protein
MSVGFERYLYQGCEVKTVYGWGILVKILNDSNEILNCIPLRHSETQIKLEVELTWGTTGSTCNPTLFTGPRDIIISSFCPIGTCVETKYGPGQLNYQFKVSDL